jgi:hypothetical protein
VEGRLGPLMSPSQVSALNAELKQPRTPDRPLNPHAIHVMTLPQPPPPPHSRPTTHAVFDPDHARRDKLQQALLCSTFGGTIPGVPTACPPSTTVLGFDDLPPGTEISNQYAVRGVTFGPSTSKETSAPQVAKAGSEASSGANVLHFGRCSSPSCEFGMQSQLTGTFTAPRTHLGMFIGEFSPGIPTTVTFKAYDASNRLVGEKQAALTPGNGFHTPLTIDSSSATITRFVISAPDQVGGDDFAFS